jgi:hypothetical protein
MRWNADPLVKARKSYIKHAGWCPTCHTGRMCLTGRRLYSAILGARQWQEAAVRVSRPES